MNLLKIFSLTIILGLLCQTNAEAEIQSDVSATQWKLIELSFQAEEDISDPIHSVDFFLNLTSPEGKEVGVRGFWDGEKAWKVRFQPNQVGAWTYTTSVSGKNIMGLSNQSGKINVSPYIGENPLYSKGKIEVSPSGRYFQHADGTPFFWLGDTNWSGAHKANSEDWTRYLEVRNEQGFNVVQVMMTNSLAFTGNADGRQAYVGSDHIQIDPDFFKPLDQRLQQINDSGMLIAGVLIWSATWNKIATHLNPGQALSESEIILLARYLMARYAAYHVVWFLGGDQDYTGDASKRWFSIGRKVFDVYPDALVSMHPSGKRWVGSEFESEDWFKFHSYQSGHWTDDESTRWLQTGPPAIGWKSLSARPVLNAEPGYEDHVVIGENRRWTADEVRARLYWSLLNAPTAGVTYGGHGVWSWETFPAVPQNHGHALVAKPWYKALYLPGATQVKHIREIFSSFEWWTLMPESALVINQSESPEKFIAASTSKEAGLVAYVPSEQTITISKSIGATGEATWWNTRTGTAVPATIKAARNKNFEVTPPGAGDWVLHIKPKE